MHNLSRRRFLRVVADLAGGALTISLAYGASAVFPTYMPTANWPKPDFPTADQ